MVKTIFNPSQNVVDYFTKLTEFCAIKSPNIRVDFNFGNFLFVIIIALSQRFVTAVGEAQQDCHTFQILFGQGDQAMGTCEAMPKIT